MLICFAIDAEGVKVTFQDEMLHGITVFEESIAEHVLEGANSEESVNVNSSLEEIC